MLVMRQEIETIEFLYSVLNKYFKVGYMYISTTLIYIW